MDVKLHAVIVSYRRLPLLVQCVESFVATCTCPYTLMIVDNGSDVATRHWIQENARRLGYRYLLLSVNRYPGYAANRGWEMAPPSATLLMRSDNDSLWLPGWSDDALEAFNDPEVGQYGPVAEGDETWTIIPDWPVGGNTIIRREIFTDWLVRYDETPWPEATMMQEDHKLYVDIRDRGWRRAWGKRPGLVFAGMRDPEYDREVAEARGRVWVDYPMISVVVPTLDGWQHTALLLGDLARQPCRVLVIDNMGTGQTGFEVRRLQRCEEWRGRLHVTRRPGSIYQLWNLGFDWARKGARRGAWHVLLTNNDIRLPPDALLALREPLEDDLDAWVTYPDVDAAWDAWEPPHGSFTRWRETKGVLGDGGMLGACFMLAGHRIPWRPLITDLTYEWWYGDNHLAEEIEQHGGKQIRVEGLPVLHVNEATASQLPPGELYGMKYRDRQRWLQRYERK